jgi:signal transduction histidine kinase
LAFCKLAVEAHGQQIWADSLPGHGTVFTFTLAAAI